MAYKVGVMGAAGFAGVELVRLLVQHPDFELVAVTSDADAGKAISETYPAFTGMGLPAFTGHDDAVLYTCDLVFLAVPHTVALKYAPLLLKSGVTVVDLSADYRLKDPQVYEQWYGTPHTSVDILANAAFGLPEITGSELARAAAEFAAGKMGNRKTAGGSLTFPMLRR